MVEERGSASRSYFGLEASIVKLNNPVKDKLPNLHYSDMAMLTPLNKAGKPDKVSAKAVYSQKSITLSSSDSDANVDVEKRNISGCVNCACTSDTTAQYFEADSTILNYYKVKEKKHYRRNVCSKCRDVVNDKIASLVSDLQTDKPLLEMKFDRIEEVIELSDSDSENELRSTGSSVEITDDVRKDGERADDSDSGDSLDGVFEEVWQKFSIEDKLEAANKQLNTKLDDLTGDSNEITDLMKENQKLLDDITQKLYKNFQNNRPSINDNSQRVPRKENETESQRFIRLSIPSFNKAVDYKPPHDNDAAAPPFARYMIGKINVNEYVLYFTGKHDKPWELGKVFDVYNKGASPNKNSDHYAYKIGPLASNRVPNSCWKLLTGVHVAYPRPPRIRHVVGTRVLSEFVNPDFKRGWYSGTILEVPSPVNNSRCLVMFDTGHAEYFNNSELRTISEQDDNSWDFCPKWVKKFIKEYIDNYPMRTMCLLSLGQSIMLDGFEPGDKSKSYRVIGKDFSIVQLKNIVENKFMWIYRGAPCFRASSIIKFSSVVFDQINAPSQSAKKTKPNVLYTFKQMQTPSTMRASLKQAEVNTSQHLRTLRQIRPAPLKSTQTAKGLRQIRPGVPLLRSTSPRSTHLHIPVQPSTKRTTRMQLDQMIQVAPNRVMKKFSPMQRGPFPQPRLVPQTMPGQRAFMQNMLNKQKPEYKLLPHQTEQMPEHSKVMFFTPKSFVKTLNYVNHECSRSCCREIGVDLRNYNPLTKPFLCGWERRTCKGMTGGDVSIFVYYRAPCGVRIRNMAELHKYLQLVRSQLGVDYFDFNPSMQCLAEFTLTRCFVSMKDISSGKENVPIPCVNYFDHSLPKMCIYSSVRTPTRGVSLNLDPDFLCGCDCVDDCQDREKCACWQLTLEGARAIGMEGDDVGYQYRRLLQPITTGIYECNSRCSCRKTCLNRVAQFPLQLKLQVYRTVARGWGLRSMNDVPRGSFICIYAGNLLTEASANTDGMVGGDEYLAELDYIEGAERMKEGYEADVEAEKKEKEEGGDPDRESEEDEDEYLSSSSEDQDRDDKDDEDFRPDRHLQLINSEMRKRLRKRNEEKARKKLKSNEPPEKTYKSAREYFGEDECCYVMDAKIQGNLGRFLNHSCAPNVFVQNVFVDTHDLRFPWVAFFALADIKAGSELTWNYNYEIGSVPGRIINCKCGAAMCKGRLL